MKRIFVTDKEVAAICEMSWSTLSRVLSGSFYKKNDGKKRIDLAKAEPEFVGNSRRWRVSKLASVLGITEEELLSRIA